MKKILFAIILFPFFLSSQEKKEPIFYFSKVEVNDKDWGYYIIPNLVYLKKKNNKIDTVFFMQEKVNGNVTTRVFFDKKTTLPEVKQTFKKSKLIEECFYNKNGTVRMVRTFKNKKLTEKSYKGLGLLTTTKNFILSKDKDENKKYIETSCTGNCINDTIIFYRFNSGYSSGFYIREERFLGNYKNGKRAGVWITDTTNSEGCCADIESILYEEGKWNGEYARYYKEDDWIEALGNGYFDTKKNKHKEGFAVKIDNELNEGLYEVRSIDYNLVKPYSFYSWKENDFQFESNKFIDGTKKIPLEIKYNKESINNYKEVYEWPLKKRFNFFNQNIYCESADLFDEFFIQKHDNKNVRSIHTINSIENWNYLPWEGDQYNDPVYLIGFMNIPESEDHYSHRSFNIRHLDTLIFVRNKNLSLTEKRTFEKTLSKMFFDKKEFEKIKNKYEFIIRNFDEKGILTSVKGKINVVKGELDPEFNTTGSWEFYLSNKKNDTSFVYHLNKEGDTIMMGYYRNGIPIGSWYLNKKIDCEFDIEAFLAQNKNKEYNSLFDNRQTTLDSLILLIIKNEGVKALSYEKGFTLFEHGLKTLTPNGFYFRGEIDIAKFLKIDEVTKKWKLNSSNLGILNSLTPEYSFLARQFADEEEDEYDENGDDEIERPDKRFNREHINREMKSLGFK